MPFTLSHPAAILPLVNRGLPLSALVIGSIAPDLPYFFRQTTSDQSGHSLLGVFTYCVPVGLLLFAVFHLVLKEPLVSLLPPAHQIRLAEIVDSTKISVQYLNKLPTLVIALAIGALSHIVWDSFTHANGWAVRQIPFLQTVVLRNENTSVALFKLLQHGSSLVGLALMTYCYHRWFNSKSNVNDKENIDVTRPSKVPLLIVLAIISLIVAGNVALLKGTMTESAGPVQALIRQFVLTAIATLGFEILIYSAYWHWREKRNSGRIT